MSVPKLRPDLVFVEQTYRGEQSYIVKDPQTRKYFRFGPTEVRVMQSLDGVHTTEEAAAGLVEEGLRVSAGALDRFAVKLKAMGLLERTLGERSVLMMERLRAQRRQRLSNGPFQGDILRLRWSVGDPDHLMDRTIPYLRFFFSRPFLIGSVFLFAIYLLVLAVKWPDFTRAMTDLYQFNYPASTLFVFWCTGMIIIVFHELGHGYTCKYFGGQVHEIGAMLIYFEPAFYCNVNDSWTFPDLKARLWVTAAGSWIQLVLASIGAIVWWAAAPGTLISEVALAAVLIGGVTTVLMNANPLIPLDGYFALSDYLEVPNLRQRALAYVTWLVKAKLFRLDLPTPAADEREQRIFLVYGLLAVWYISTILLFVAGVVFGWLDRALGAAGVALFALGMWLMLRDSLRAWAGTAMEAWRGARVRLAGRGMRNRVLLGAALVIVVGALVPRSITVTGPFAVVPALSIPLTAPDSGIVATVYVREGTRVQAGMPLVQIRDLELERSAIALGRESDSLGAREGQARAAGRTPELARLAAERATTAAQLEGVAVLQRGLTVRALAPGVVVTRRPEELTGQWVELGDPLLELGQPDSLELRIALSGAGATRVRPGQPVRLIFHTNGATAQARVTGVSQASVANAVEARIGVGGSPPWRPGMTGEASVTIRRSNLWGSLAWAIRRRVRTDLLL